MKQAQSTIGKIDSTLHHTRQTLADGATISWRHAGDGAPLVLIHGGHGNWMHWLHNITPLSQTHTVWVPDMPGYGESDALPPDADFDALVARMLHSLDALFGADTAIDLAGFSFGALVAASLAACRATRRLVLIGTAGHGRARRPHPSLQNWKLASSPEARSACFAANVAAFMIHDPARIDATALAAYETACLATRFRSREIAESADILPLLRQAAVPTMLLWGDADVTAADPEVFAARLAAAGIDHRFDMVPGAGHWAQYEASDEINRRMRAFLDSAD